MVINYSKKIVYDYINGEDIDNVDDLENDPNFMMDVINITRDKKMYNLCSDNLKKEHGFVMFMIDIFKKDKEFINDVAMEYLNSLDSDDIRYKEICFVMSDIFSDRDDDRAIYYNLLRTAVYSSERMSIDYVINTEKDMYIKRQMGLGFAMVLYSDLGKSVSITNYFAIKYLEELFYEKEDMTLEDLIHNKFPLLETLQKAGVKNFIIDYVRNYDIYLSDYIFVHTDLFKNIENDINKIIKNWDYYLEKNFGRKMDIFEQEVAEILDVFDCNFDFFTVCKYLDDLRLNIPVKFGNYYELDIMFPIDINTISLPQYNCLKKIVLLTKNLFSSCVIDKNFNVLEDDISDNIVRKKVINFKTNNG